MDFVADTFGASRKFRILAINYDVAGRTCPGGGHQHLRGSVGA
jgi:hypothetical protein